MFHMGDMKECLLRAARMYKEGSTQAWRYDPRWVSHAYITLRRRAPAYLSTAAEYRKNT